MPGPACKEMYPLYRSERIWGAQWPEIGHSPPPPPLTSQIGKSTFAFSEQRNCREKSKIQDLKIVDNRNPLLPVWTCESFMGGSTFGWKRSITIRHSKGDVATSFRFFYADHQRFLFRKWLSGRILVDLCFSQNVKSMEILRHNPSLTALCSLSRRKYNVLPKAFVAFSITGVIWSSRWISLRNSLSLTQPSSFHWLSSSIFTFRLVVPHR